MKTEFRSKSNKLLIFRELTQSDGEALGSFFESLSDETRSKYGPHPLTKEHALLLCIKIGIDNVKRLIILNTKEIIGYFVLDFNPFEHEAARYKEYGIELDERIDPVFAPCISDNYQNQGIASEAMKLLLNYARSKNLRSIVLMGGTQEPNKVAQSFYKKFGFKEYGRFYTDHNGLNNIDMKLML